MVDFWSHDQKYKLETTNSENRQIPEYKMYTDSNAFQVSDWEYKGRQKKVNVSTLDSILYVADEN